MLSRPLPWVVGADKVGGSLLAASKCPKGRTTLTENSSNPNSSWGSLGTENPESPTGQSVSGSQPAKVVNGGAGTLKSAMKELGTAISTQDGGFKVLFERASNLEVVAKKTHSPAVSTAISELLEVIKGLSGSKKDVIRTYNTAVDEMKLHVARDRGVPSLTSSSCAATQTDSGVMDVVDKKRTSVKTTDASTNTVVPSPFTQPEKQPRALNPDSQPQQTAPRRRKRKNQRQQQHQQQKQQQRQQQKEQEKMDKELGQEQPPQLRQHTWSQVVSRGNSNKKENTPPPR
ncbi:phospholipase D A-like [Rhopalosiphum maidis]|uniref:phospholipase D A-like n=1 Tax=Rhopalosiphum maidis TaxID=43146 RepID=UPI000EFE5BB6|nr:phospholipase D A-like [Rhopalosiphum maidis]